MGSLLGAAVAGCLFALMRAARHSGDFATLWADPESWLIVTVSGAMAGGLAALLISTIQRRPIIQIAPAPPAPAPAPAPVVPVSVRAKQRQTPFLGRMPVACLSKDLRWEKVSRPLQKMLGISGKKLRGRSILERIHEEDRTVIERRFRNPSKVAFEARFRLLPPKKKGKNSKPAAAMFAQLTAAPLRDSQGKLDAWRCLFVDLTRQIQAEEARQTQTAELAQAQAKWQRIQRQFDRLKESYADLYHQSPVMYFSLDAEGRFVTFNDTLLRTLGYSREELMGRKYSEIVIAKHKTPVSFDSPSEKEQEWETKWRRTDGSAVDVWLKTVAVLDEQGKFARWRSSALDFTERNRLASQLRTHTDELQRTNARLRHINSELEDFTHVVSHDLKEPLRTLQAFSRLLAEDFSAQLSTDGFQYINHLLQASERLGRLIDDLLNLSHAGRATREAQTFNLIEVVATVRRDLGDLIQRKEATLVTEGKLPAVVGDPQRITQLLTNLVANGLKYNKHAAPCVTIGQALEGADDRHVIIYVRDNGIGIDPKHHEQIFGLFRRLNNQEEYEGTGAGLAICKKIVEAHGGRIWVNSTPDQGATFYFTLPKPMAASLRNGHANHVSKPARPESVKPRRQAPRGTHVLLVEDSEVGAVIQKMGERSGLQITWLTTAEQAWEWLRDGRPDFLLLDINLPAMNGKELCARIRRELHLETPVALISQEPLTDESAQLREIGADLFLSKESLSEPAVWQKRLDAAIAATQRPTAMAN